MDGIDLIARERREQKEKHGYSVEKDSLYKHKELLTLAKYLLTDDEDDEKRNYEDYLFNDEDGCKFPQSLKEKLQNKATVNKWAIAGAFIAAQIDSLIYRIQQGPNENLPK